MKKPDPKTMVFALRTVVGLLLLAAAGGLVGYLVRTAPTIETEDRPRALRVPVFVAQAVDLPRQWRGFGAVEADRQADVPARVGATVVEIPDRIEVGRIVSAGDLLVQLDDADFVKDRDAAEQRIAEISASLAQLETEEPRLRERLELELEDVELAQAEYDRQRERFEKGGASQADVDRSRRALLTAQRSAVQLRQLLDAIAPRRTGLEANRAAAQAHRDLAEQNVRRARITAPIDGIIAALDVEENENVAPGSRVVRIVDPRVIEAPIQLPASARGRVGVGDTATITSRSHPPGCTWPAEVTRIGAINDPTRTFTVFTRIDQTGVPLAEFASGGGAQQVLVPGVFVTARLVTRQSAPRWIVPARSVQEGRVRLVEDGHVVTRPVTIAYEYEGKLPRLGVEDEQWAVLNEALAEGDLVVLSASLSILDGQEVIAVGPGGEPAAAADADGEAAASNGSADPAMPEHRGGAVSGTGAGS